MRETHPNTGDHYIPGDYWMVCDECGLDYRRSEIRQRWDNAWVCEKDLEPKHPQESVRGIPEKINVPVARPVTAKDNKITSWGESSSYETFTSSNENITSAINSSGNGSARSNDTGVTSGVNYRLSVTLTITSGQAPTIITGSSGSADGTTLGTLENGPNTINFEADSSTYIYITNTSDSNFSAIFNLTKIVLQGDL